MKVRLAIVLAMAVIASPVASAAAEDPVWGDAAAWRAFDWSRLEQSALWTGSEAAPAGRNGPARTRRGLTIGQDTFDLRIATVSANPRQPAVLLTGPGRGACARADRWLRAAFGEPTRTASIRRNYGDFDSVNVLNQWSVGRTMVTSDCEQTPGGQEGGLMIRYEAVALARVVSPPIQLTCGFPNGEPFSVLLLDYYGQMRRADYSELPGRLEPLQATVQLPDDNGTMTIDRQTGVLKAESDDGANVVVGQCKADGRRAF